ncbi:MAG TPA: ATP-binding protein [Mucilaginibacter sp.]|nr:ATP-binding protein [Mucilaginibacter sp.]
MVNATHTRFIASDRSYYAIIKKEAHNIAVAAGFEAKRIAEMDIVIAEMTSNLYKYANDGEILLGHFDDQQEEYLEIICIDNGPGIGETNRMLTDGFSTTNTLGHGLGSIKRLSDQFDIYSQKGWGTIVLSRIYKGTPKKKDKKAIIFNPVVIAKPGEIVSGDGSYLKKSENVLKFIVADGLGHGPEANKAVNEAVNSFKVCPYDSPCDIIRYLHQDVRKTRGLVATIGVIDIEKSLIRIAGVGNISAKLIGPVLSRTHLAYNGIIGHNIPNTMNDLVLSFSEYNQLILCSDGMRSRWDLSKVIGIGRCDPSIQAAALYKDFGRQTDDMSAVIIKIPKQ